MDKLIEFTNDETLHKVSIHKSLLDVITGLGFEQDSWHNDAFPRFSLDHGNGEDEIHVWVDYDDPNNSEYGPENFVKYRADRYTDCSFIDTIAESNDPAVIIKAVSNYVQTSWNY